MKSRPDFAICAFLALGLLAWMLPLGAGHSWLAEPGSAATWLLALAIGSSVLAFGPGSIPILPTRIGSEPASDESIHTGVGDWTNSLQVLLTFAGAAIGALVPLRLIASGIGGENALGLWCAVLALGFVVWRLMERTSNLAAASGSRALNLAVPALFGLWILYLWEVLVNGFSIPRVLLPPPSEIGGAIVSSSSTLVQDFIQTVVKCVLPGYLLGNLAGIVTALIVDRFPFMKRGILPIGNLFSSLPIIGLAPIMVMWFGFDWQSKAAIVVIMTFFPMLVNTIAGLAETSQIERDLMRTYAASYWQTLATVRLPAALPFIFNALKINSTLALIGAIVAEFFGGPTVGIGFRITTEVGRMNISTVWAAIAVAAASGSIFYGLLALLERRSTFWHPSIRQRDHDMRVHQQ